MPSGTVILALALGLGIGLSVNSESNDDNEMCKESKHGKCYKNGAVATDDERCSVVGANLLRKAGHKKIQSLVIKRRLA